MFEFFIFRLSKTNFVKKIVPSTILLFSRLGSSAKNTSDCVIIDDGREGMLQLLNLLSSSLFF